MASVGAMAHILHRWYKHRYGGRCCDAEEDMEKLAGDETDHEREYDSGLSHSPPSDAPRTPLLPSKPIPHSSDVPSVVGLQPSIEFVEPDTPLQSTI